MRYGVCRFIRDWNPRASGSCGAGAATWSTLHNTNYARPGAAFLAVQGLPDLVSRDQLQGPRRRLPALAVAVARRHLAERALFREVEQDLARPARPGGFLRDDFLLAPAVDAEHRLLRLEQALAAHEHHQRRRLHAFHAVLAALDRG